MKCGNDGWYEAEEPLYPGTRYGFVLNNETGYVLPDPRSAFQPDGVNGLSQAVDHSAFSWTDQNWQARPLASALIYEMHVGTFTPQGTFDAAIERLPYLAGIGVTHLELMPVAEFSGDWGWGYDGVDLFAPHHCYGGPDGLKRLVDAAHSNGLAVILDVVYNHLGPAGNYLNRFGPYFTTRHKTPWGDAVNLDGPYCYEVRRFFIDNAKSWLRDYHFDGLRLDAVHALVDNGATHFLEELSEEVEKLSIHLGRHFSLIAESDLNDPRVIRSRQAGGYGIDAQWSDDFHHALHTLLTRESKSYYADFGNVADLAKTYNEVFVYNGNPAPSRRRPHGRPVDNLPAYKFLGYIQNHDQIGNRARGERLSHLVDLPQVKLAAGLVLTAPFIPMLFQGEEWCASAPFLYFTQHDDAELARAVSEGRRSEFVEFGWTPDEVPDPQALETYCGSKLRWEEKALPPHSEMLDWHRTLIAIRRGWPELTEPSLYRNEASFSEPERWLTVRRGSLTIVANFNPESRTIPVSADVKSVLLASIEEAVLQDGSLRTGPWGFVVCQS